MVNGTEEKVGRDSNPLTKPIQVNFLINVNLVDLNEFNQ